MKIIHIVLGKANPDRMNGVNKVVHQLACAQHAEGQQVEIWGITRDLTAAAPQRGFATRLFAHRKGGFAFDPRLLAALKAVSEPLVVHFHGGFIPVFSRLAAALNRVGIPYCHTAHGAYNTLAMRKSRWKKAFYFALAEKRMLRKARAVHCIGASELEAVKRRLPAAKTVLIPNGHQMPEQQGPRPITEAAMRFVFCGRLRMHTKGLDILLGAFARYRSAAPGKLTLIGDGEDRNRLQEMAASLGISADVEFAGAQYGEDKDALLRTADVFLHPSRNEGMPGAVLEAAGMGIPVIVSKGTNLAEAVDAAEAGIALKQNDSRHLALALQHAASARRSGLLAAWSENAAAMVAQQFSWPFIAQLHQKMYQG